MLIINLIIRLITLVDFVSYSKQCFINLQIVTSFQWKGNEYQGYQLFDHII